MSFQVRADAYARFMGAFAADLADQTIELVGVRAGQRALDVGCGTGELTSRLVDRLGADAVAAIEPSRSFVDATAERLPGVDVRHGSAEQLPFADASVDLAIAQLVVHFMADPVLGLAEMARVTHAGGRVAASVWDYAGGRGPWSLVWRAAHDLDPAAPDEDDLAGVREGHLAELFAAAGMHDIRHEPLTVRMPFDGLDDWWERLLLGVGPPGAYVTSLSERHRAELRARCAELLATGPVEVEATAWTVVAQL